MSESRANLGFQAFCETIRIHDPAFTLASPRETLRPERRDTAGLPTVEDLQAVSLEMAETIGEGGMGIVRAALQPSLMRRVAVKGLHPDRVNPDSSEGLLREALITGALEHPNVIPIYDLVRDPRAGPLLVMKRVAGRSWQSVIDEQQGKTLEIAWLETQLETLIQVCHAVEYAHSRRIIHRDLKPDNVMLGHFGEVYVLDWGIAVTVDPEETRFPRGCDVDTIAGTPAYMAPEQAESAGSRLNEQTDVYLLGAILHELLCGRPPHLGETVQESLFLAYESEAPVFDSDIPTELGVICRRAMATNPGDRYLGAADLRAAIKTFLRHRAAIEITDHAVSRLEALSELVGTDTDEVVSLFGETCSGFRHALTIWPENLAARAGIQRTLETMVDHWLAVEKPRAAVGLLSQLPDARPRLAGRVESALARARADAAENERLRSLGEQFDGGTGSGMRRILLLIIAVVWAGLPMAFAVGYELDLHRPSREGMMVFAAGFALFVVAVAWFGRGWIFSTAVNRLLLRALAATAAYMVLARYAQFVVEVPVYYGAAADLMVFGLVIAIVGGLIDPRMYFASAAYFACGVVGLWVPEKILWSQGIGNLVALTIVAGLWGRHDKARDLRKTEAALDAMEEGSA